MKKIFPAALALLFSLTLLPSCQKQRTCKYSYFYRPFGLVFVGYTNSELSPLVIQAYAKNSHYTQMLFADTVTIAGIERSNDTIYSSGRKTIFDITDQYDYKVSMVNAGAVFTIDSIQTGPESYSWQQRGECGVYATSARVEGYSSIRVNGIEQHVSFFGRTAEKFVYYMVK